MVWTLRGATLKIADTDCTPMFWTRWSYISLLYCPHYCDELSDGNDGSDNADNRLPSPITLILCYQNRWRLNRARKQNLCGIYSTWLNETIHYWDQKNNRLYFPLTDKRKKRCPDRELKQTSRHRLVHSRQEINSASFPRSVFWCQNVCDSLFVFSPAPCATAWVKAINL